MNGIKYSKTRLPLPLVYVPAKEVIQTNNDCHISLFKKNDLLKKIRKYVDLINKVTNIA